MTAALALGAALGLLTGLASALGVEKARRFAAQALFVRIWALALGFRAAAVGAAFAAVWVLRPAHPACFLLALVFAQTAAQFVKLPDIWILKK